MWVKNAAFIRGLSGGIKKAMGAIADEERINLQRTLDKPAKVEGTTRSGKPIYDSSGSAGGPPYRRSGDLHDSIKAKITQADATRVAITFSANTPYAAAVEFGAGEHMAARPFLRPHRTRFAKRFINKLTQKLAKQGG